MSKKIKGKDILNEISFKYINSEKAEIIDINDYIPKLDLLVNNNLGIKETHNDYIGSSCENFYRIVAKFMQKYNKFLKVNRRPLRKYEFGLKNSITSKTNLELLELTKYVMESGMYFAKLDKNNYAFLKQKVCEGGNYTIDSTFYIIGKDYKKYKKKLNKMIDKYNNMNDTKREEKIIYKSTRRTISTVFKSFDDVIYSDKKDIIKYIDNWIESIPTYYNKYNMIPKLSVMLYGDPGTGKSTFYKALAKYLDINQVTVLDQSSFYSSFEGERDSDYYQDYKKKEPTIYAIDDIDCVCQSRENSKNKINNAVLSNLLAFLDNPPTFDFTAKDGIVYPVSIVVATTNYFDKLDKAVRRYGRFDLLIEMKNFNKKLAQQMCDLYELKLSDLVKDSDKKDFSISPSKLQALCLKNIDSKLKNVEDNKSVEKTEGTILIHRKKD